jgi:hypothetical protein
MIQPVTPTCAKAFSAAAITFMYSGMSFDHGAALSETSAIAPRSSKKSRMYG